MFEIAFFQRADKFVGGNAQERWAKIILKEDDWCSCEEPSGEIFKIIVDEEKCNNIPLVQDNDSSFDLDFEDASEGIKEAIQKHNFKPEVILSTALMRMYEMIYSADKGKISLNVLVTPHKNILHYFCCGVDNEILIVSFTSLKGLF